MRRFRVDVPFGLSLTLRTDVPGELAVEYAPDPTAAHARAPAVQAPVPVPVHGDGDDRARPLPERGPTPGPSPRPLSPMSPIAVDASDSDDMEWGEEGEEGEEEEAVPAGASGVSGASDAPHACPSPARTAAGEWEPEPEVCDHPMLEHDHRPAAGEDGPHPHHHHHRPSPVASEMSEFEPSYTMYRLSPSPPPPPQLNIADFERHFDDAGYPYQSPSASPRLWCHTPDFEFDDTREHYEHHEHQGHQEHHEYHETQNTHTHMHMHGQAPLPAVSPPPLIINTSDTLDLDPASTPPAPPHPHHQLFPAALPSPTSPTDTEPIEPIYAPPSSPQAAWTARLLAAHHIRATDYAFPPHSTRLPPDRTAPTLFDPSLALHAYLAHHPLPPLHARRLWSLGWLTGAEARAAVHPAHRAQLAPLFAPGERGAGWVPLRDAEPPRGWTWGRQRALVGARVRERYAYPPAYPPPAPRLQRRHSVDCGREVRAWAPAKRRRLSPESDAGGYHEFRQRVGVRVRRAGPGLGPEAGGVQGVRGVQGGPADVVDTPPPSPGGVPPDAPAARVIKGLPLRRTETFMRL